MIKTAHEVLPDANLHFAHQAAWAMAAEINRLRGEMAALRAAMLEIYNLSGPTNYPEGAMDDIEQISKRFIERTDER